MVWEEVSWPFKDESSSISRQKQERHAYNRSEMGMYMEIIADEAGQQVWGKNTVLLEYSRTRPGSHSERQ